MVKTAAVLTVPGPDAIRRRVSSQIQNRRKSTVSLMPERLADKMTPQPLANLVAFLLTGAK